MPYPTFTLGPVTYLVVEDVPDAVFVEGRAGGGVGVAAAASAKVVGVSIKAGKVAPTDTGNPLDVSQAQNRIPVAQAPHTVAVTYSAAANFGDRVAVTTGGKAAPAASNPVVGFCAQPGGVSANAVGLVKLD